MDLPGLDAHFDRLHDEYFRDYAECPECGCESLDGESGRSRGGWWWKAWCIEDGCDYEADECEDYEPA
jgi:hypothetical protein